MEKPQKQSNLVGFKIADVLTYVRQLDRDVTQLTQYINRFPKTYIQSTEPTIPNDSFAFWKDTDDGKFYLIKDIGGTQKKVELL